MKQIVVVALIFLIIVKTKCDNAEEGANIEGDILAPPAHDGIASGTYKWKDGVVPYMFAPDYPKKVRVKNAMEEFHKYTCIRFREATRNDLDYIYIVDKQPVEECSSYIGKQGFGRQIINLSVDGCMKYGTIIHELMHALGIVHEQSRKDRDQYIKILWDNIRDGAEHNFDKPRVETVDYGVPYNSRSVMHYSLNAFSKNRNLNTMEILDPNIDQSKVGQRDTFNCSDLRKILRMYKCYLPEKFEKVCGHDHSKRDETAVIKYRLCTVWKLCDDN